MIKSVLPLSLVIALRFLGLFLVLPVISVYALSLQGATTTLVGVIVGGYALTQMIFQVPFGIMSDKLGRKGTIITGLLIFAIGSLICFLSTDIYSLMLGRLLQGSGAIGSVITASISDLVKEEQRSKAMAMMGMFIGTSFAISMMAGPLISAYFGVESLFILTMFLALISIFVIIKKVPNPPKITHTYNGKTNLKEVFFDTNLLKMNLTNFLQKGFMTFAFMIIPITLIHSHTWEKAELWKVYLPAMILGFISMAPAAILAEKKGKFREILILGIVLFAISYLIMGFAQDAIIFIIGVTIFFIGFNMHEPIMQSLASKFAKVHQRGLVLGIFNSFGYFGTFLGGLIGGKFYATTSLSTLAITICIICIVWAILIFLMPNPSKRKFVYLSLAKYKADKEKLSNNKAIDEWYINNTENIIAIKYDEDTISCDEIKNLLK